MQRFWQDKRSRHPLLTHWGTILLTFTAAIISSRLLCKEIEILVFNFLRSHGANGHTAALVGYLAQVVLVYDLTLIAATWLGLRMLGINLQEIGWKKPESATRIFASVLIMTAVVFSGGIISALLKSGSFHGYTLGLSESFRNAGFASAYIILFVKVFNTPIEELFYRGFIQTALGKNLHASWAIVLTASLFAIAHIGINKSITQVFISGLIYSLLRNWGNSLWNPIAAHLTKNSIASYVTIGYR